MVQGILMALLQRTRTGRGQRVEVSLYDSLLAMQVLEATMALMGRDPLNWARMPLVGTFATADGEVVLVGAFKPNPLRDICEALDLEDLSDDPSFATMANQAANRPRLQALIAAAIGGFTSAEVIERLEAQDVLCAPVRTLGEALEDPHTASMIVELPRPDRAPLRSVASPVHLPDAPAPMLRPPPAPGEGASRGAGRLRDRARASRRANRGREFWREHRSGRQRPRRPGDDQPVPSGSTPSTGPTRTN